MARAPLRDVRWLTLEELATDWALELHRQQALVLRELRLGVINLPRLEQGLGRVPEFPSEEELPPVDHRVDRDWVERFAAKNKWPRPRFWFDDAPAGRPAGRPRFVGWEPVRQELERRIREREAEESWRAESNYLAGWAREHYPRDRPPAAKTIRNQLTRFREELLTAQN